MCLTFQDFLYQILQHLEKRDEPRLCYMFHNILQNPPSLNPKQSITNDKNPNNWFLQDTNLTLLQQSLVQGIENIPSITKSMKSGVQSLSTRICWKHEIKLETSNSEGIRKKTWATSKNILNYFKHTLQ